MAAARRAAADKLQELQGAIRVLVRCRPLSRAELALGGGSLLITPNSAARPLRMEICWILGCSGLRG